MDIALRPYQPRDATTLAALFHAAVHAIDEALYEAADREAWAPTPPDIAVLRERFAQIPPIVACTAGVPAGYMSMDGHGLLDHAYVHPRHQGQGIASALYARLEREAQERRLARVYATASAAARPAFERWGFACVRDNTVVRRGRSLRNALMDKRLARLPGAARSSRIFVVGSSGAGKSTLASALGTATGRPHVDLDSVAFSDAQGTRRPLADSLRMLRAKPGFESAVVEGCYADLMVALARPTDHLVWLDPGVEACVEHAKGRPFEPHKWSSKQDQDAFLPALIAFIASYDDDPAPTGRAAHEALFAAFPGTKEHHANAITVDRLCEDGMP